MPVRKESKGQYLSDDELVQQHMELVYWCASKLKPYDRKVDFDDIVQAGYLGLKRANELFDPSKGYKFSTYAAQCIRSHILRFYTNWHGNKEHVKGRLRREAAHRPIDGIAQYIVDSEISEDHSKYDTCHDVWQFLDTQVKDARLREALKWMIEYDLDKREICMLLELSHSYLYQRIKDTKLNEKFIKFFGYNPLGKNED